MNSYKALLKVRRWKRDLAIAVVQNTQQEISVLLGKIDELAQAIHRWTAARKQLQHGIVKIDLWQANEAYRNRLLDSHRQLEDEVNTLETRLARERALLLEQEVAVKQIEKLIEKEGREQAFRSNATEQQTIDDWASLQASTSRTTRP